MTMYPLQNLTMIVQMCCGNYGVHVIARLLTAEQTMLLHCVTCYAFLTLAIKNILHSG